MTLRGCFVLDSVLINDGGGILAVPCPLSPRDGRDVILLLT